MKKDSQIRKEGKLPIRVSREVVSHLSLGLYRNFARAAKELISNSYDANATEVKIKLDLDNARIVVKDNGYGMDLQKLRDEFLTIGYPTPLTESVNELGRKRIGTFGIGCVSVFPYCKTLRVVTKKRGSREIIELTINTGTFFKGGTFLIGEAEKAEAPYKIFKSDLPEEKGETIIVLEGIAPQIAKELRKKSLGKASIDKFSGFQKFRWALSQYAPIQFPPDRKDLKNFFDDPKRIPLRLWLDGKELFRNTPENTVILEKEEKKFGDVLLKYAIMTSMKPIGTEEARGLQIRLRDVAIGLPRDFDVTKLTGKVLGKLNYLCGEIHIIGGLHSALMIDRDSFSYTQEVDEIFEFFRKKLTKWNDILETKASADKKIYESLVSLKGSERVIEELKSAGVINFPKERLRIPKKPIIKRKITGVLPLSEKIVDALSKNKDYEIIPKKGKVPSRKPPIEVIRKKKSVIVYVDHPAFTETMEIDGRKFDVRYDKWDPNETPYSICKIYDDQNKVVFNALHPLFKSKLSDEIIKRLSLGIVFVLRDREEREELVKKLTRLLEDVFQG